MDMSTRSVWSAYVIETGALTGRLICDTEAGRDANTWPGEAWIEGEADPLRQRVEMTTDDFGEHVPVLVAWQPPAPAYTAYQTWAWSNDEARWLPSPTLVYLKLMAIEPLIADLDAIDTKIVRPATEITAAQAAGEEPDSADVARLNELRAEKAALRTRMAAINAAEDQDALQALLASES